MPASMPSSVRTRRLRLTARGIFLCTASTALAFSSSDLRNGYRTCRRLSKRADGSTVWLDNALRDWC